MIMKVGGHFVIRHYRNGKLLARYRIKNGITNAGLNHILGVQFRNQSQSAIWYFGLIDGAAPPTLAAADTMSSHSGWTENTDYSNSTRRTWTPVVSGTGVIVNTSYPSFNINGSATISGAFIVNSNTKGGSSGDLWSTALFSNGNAIVESGDVLKTYYELTANAA